MTSENPAFLSIPNIKSLLICHGHHEEENTSMAKNTNSHKIDNNTAVRGGLGFEAMKF